jgi:NAD(P)-dependent dehydrogenase (short-subunit alcohol dehydrogenase family)
MTDKGHGSPLAIVTGGASGIGAATVMVLAEAGWRPLVVDIRPEGEAPALVWPEPVDIADEAAVERAVAGIEEAHGPVAGLVNAAGILGRMHPPERLRMADWDREMAVDLRGTFLACRAVGPRMAARRAGAIVNVASVVGMSSAPVHGYGPAKAVSPGFTRTPSLELGLRHGVLKEPELVQGAALRRLVEPAEVGRAIAWLLGPESSAVTGVNIPVDAGFLAGIIWAAYGGLRGT